MLMAMKTGVATSPPSSGKKTTLQSLTKIPAVNGLYRHENGTYYGKKKIRGVKKVAALTTANEIGRAHV